MHIFPTYMALVIQLIVGQFEFIKTDNLPHPGVSRGQWIRMNVNPWGHRGIGIARYHPLGAVIHVPDRYKNGGKFYDLKKATNHNTTQHNTTLVTLSSLKISPNHIQATGKK